MIDRTDPTNRDTVPAMLTPGEFVVNKEASQMYGPVIESMNNAGLQKRAMKNNMVSANMGSSIPPKYLNLGGGSVSERDKVVRVPLMSTIKQHEGYRDYVYDDGFGNPTIGYGHLLPDSYKKFMWNGKDESTKHKPYSETELDELLVSDLATAEKGAQNNFDNWSQLPKTVQDGLTNMSFQLGAAGQAKFVKMKDAVEANDFTEAAKQAKDSKWHTETPTRSTHLANIFLDQTPERSSDVLAPGYGEMTPQDFLDQAETFNTPGSAMMIPQAEPTVANIPNTMLSSKDPSFTVPTMREAPPVSATPSPPSSSSNAAPVSFGQAFKEARASMGAGQVFEHNGKQFSTNYAEEEETMTANMGGKACACGKKSVCDCGGIQNLNVGDWVKSLKGLLGNSEPDDDETLLNNSSQSIDEIARANLKKDVENSWFPKKARERLSSFDKGTRLVNPPREVVPEPVLYSEPERTAELKAAMESTMFPKNERADLYNHNKRVSQINQEMINPQPISYNESDRGVPIVTRPPPDLSSNESPFEQMSQIDLENYIKGSLPSAPGNQTAQEVYLRRFKLNNVDPTFANNPPQLPNNERDLRDLPPDYFTTEMDNSLQQRLENQKRRMDERGGPRTLEDIKILSQLDQFDVDRNAQKLEAMDLQLAPINSKINEAQSEINDIQKFLDDNPSLPPEMKTAMEEEIKNIKDDIKPSVETSNIITQSMSNQTRLTKDLTPPYIAPDNAPTLTERLSVEAPTLDAEVEGVVQPVTEESKNKSQTLSNQQMTQTITEKLGSIKVDPVKEPDADNLPEVKQEDVPEAESFLKSFFGDIFDAKELKRAAVMYLGARLTGLNGNQALAFAGKQYIGRTDAKENTYQKVALEGKHTDKSLALYKKSMDPNDLILKGVAMVRLGDKPEERFDTVTGQKIMAFKYKNPTTGGVQWMREGGVTPIDYNRTTTDARFAPNTPENAKMVTETTAYFSKVIEELQDLPQNRTEGKNGGKGNAKLPFSPSTIGASMSKYMIANKISQEEMTLMINNIYSEAVSDIDSGKKSISSLDDYLTRSWIEVNTRDADNFLMKDQKTPVAIGNVKSFLTTVRNAASGTGVELMNDTNLTSWLVKQDAYTTWQGLPNSSKTEFIDRGNKEGRSGMMQYMVEDLAKGV